MTAEDGILLLRVGTSIVNRKDPDRYPEAIYYLAKAVSRMAASADRESADQYLRKVYVSWHGDLSELEVTMAAAAVAKTLPADWTIPSAAEVAKLEIEVHDAWVKSHPELALWRDLRIRLAAPDAMEYFAAGLKDAQMPT